MLNKKNILSLLKWVFAITVLVLLVRSGKLSPEHIHTFVSHPMIALLCLACTSVVVLCAFLRWKFLLEGVGLPLPYGTVFKLGMLGQFFSVIIPGTVGGDLVKAFYVAKRYPLLKAKTLSTIFLDRFMGLFALIIFGGISFLVGLEHIRSLSGPTILIIQSLGWILVSGAVVIIGFLSLFSGLGRIFPSSLPASLLNLPAVGKILGTLYDVFLSYRNNSVVLWKALGISFVMHTGNILVFWLAANAIFGASPWGSLGLSDFILGAVLGNCAMAIPVAPLGLGVGQYAFSEIFMALGAPSVGFGAAIVTAYQIVNLLFNLSGSVFFATYKHDMEVTQAASA